MKKLNFFIFIMCILVISTNSFSDEKKNQKNDFKFQSKEVAGMFKHLKDAEQKMFKRQNELENCTKQAKKYCQRTSDIVCLRKHYQIHSSCVKLLVGLNKSSKSSQGCLSLIMKKCKNKKNLPDFKCIQKLTKKPPRGCRKLLSPKH